MQSKFRLIIYELTIITLEGVHTENGSQKIKIKSLDLFHSTYYYENIDIYIKNNSFFSSNTLIEHNIFFRYKVCHHVIRNVSSTFSLLTYVRKKRLRI